MPAFPLRITPWLYFVAAYLTPSFFIPSYIPFHQHCLWSIGKALIKNKSVKCCFSISSKYLKVIKDYMHL